MKWKDELERARSPYVEVLISAMQLAQSIRRAAQLSVGVGCELGFHSMQGFIMFRGSRVELFKPVNWVCTQD